jgi:hypothetical protein
MAAVRIFCPKPRYCGIPLPHITSAATDALFVLAIVAQQLALIDGTV